MRPEELWVIVVDSMIISKTTAMIINSFLFCSLIHPSQSIFIITKPISFHLAHIERIIVVKPKIVETAATKSFNYITFFFKCQNISVIPTKLLQYRINVLYQFYTIKIIK